MKKNLLYGFFFFSLVCRAQFINSFTVVPANPTTSDNIKIIANMTFSSGGCGDHQQFSSINGTIITASALHCLGPLTFICTYSDTFLIGQLQAGNYHFIFNLNAGGGPSPCSPGIVPGPTDSISFAVVQAASINELSDDTIEFLYNESLKEINFKQKRLLANAKVSIFNITGQVLQTALLTSLSQSLSVSSLKSGLYIIEVSSNASRLTKRFIVRD